MIFKRKHAIRVYKHALDIYEGKGWFKAQDHLNFVISRINFNLKNLSDALTHIEKIIEKKRINTKKAQTGKEHHHIKSQLVKSVVEFSNETNVLKDFILYNNSIEAHLNADSSLSILHMPLVDVENLKVNLSPIDGSNLSLGRILIKNDPYFDYLREPIGFNEAELISSLSDSKTKLKPSGKELKDIWNKLEEMLYVEAYRSPIPITFKPQISLYDRYTDNKQMPKIVVGETVAVMFEMKNQLKHNLILTDISLLWKFTETTDANHQEVVNISNETRNIDEALIKSICDCSVIKELSMNPNETYKVRMTIKPHRSHGHLYILGLKYRLGLAKLEGQSSEAINSTEIQSNLIGKYLFELRGPRLNNNIQAMRSVAYDTDNRLNFKIMSKTASIQVYF